MPGTRISTLLICLAVSLSCADVRADAGASLAQDAQWTGLLHYRPNFIGSFESRMEDERFFISESGAFDAEGELRAMVRALRKSPGIQCRFPARTLWLKRKMGSSLQVQPVHCPEWEKFRAGIPNRNVSLVFASYQVESAGSAFGDIFIKLSGRQNEVGMGISQGPDAETGTLPEPTFWYTFQSAIGVFPARFTSRPFHQKLGEYALWQERDLWEYDLNLTAEERALLIAHLFELRGTQLNYWSVGESSAYQLLAALDAAMPRHRLTDGLFPLVTASDAIHAVMKEPGLVSEVHFRPALESQFRYRLETLNDAEFDALDDLLGSLDEGITGLEGTKNADVLDAAMDFIDYRYQDEQKQEAHPSRRWKDALLKARARLSETREPLVMPAPLEEMPHLAHGSRRITLGTSYSFDQGVYHRLAYRFGFHDFLDPPAGFPPELDLQLGEIGIRSFTSEQRFELEKLTFLDLTSLRPFRSFDQRFSWKGKFGLHREMTDCNGCLGLEISGGPGISFDLRALPFMAYLFLEGGVFSSSGFPGSKIQFGVGPTAGARMNIGGVLVLHGEAGYRYQLMSDHAHHLISTAGARLSLWKNTAIGASGSLRSPDRFRDWHSDLGISFHYYY